MQANLNRLYKYDSDGQLLRSVGSGTNDRTEDGSELLHTIAVDSTGSVYTMTWGNPGKIMRFSPGFFYRDQSAAASSSLPIRERPMAATRP
jgi:sugar lactone lactonase YvrE